MVNIARRAHDVLGMSWATIGHLLDRDATALRRAVSASKWIPVTREQSKLAPCRNTYFNAGPK
jgi:hypothetical protein